MLRVRILARLPVTTWARVITSYVCLDYRPGDIVGIEDHFYNYLIYQLTLTVFAPVVETGANKLQPTYVLDVADAVASALRKPETAGQTYYLGGPEVLT